MTVYTYKARDASGKSVSGTMEGASKAELIERFHKMGYMPTSIAQVSPGIQIGSIFETLQRVSPDDMLLFYVQLSNMIDAGIPILTSLSTLAGQIENKNLKEAVGRVSRQVESGSTLSQAFSTEPRMFKRLFVNMIKAGEASGNLDTVLMRYANFFEKEVDLRQKIKGALFYPVILLCAGIAVTALIVVFIIPQFVEIYMKAGITLPMPTLVVYKVGMVIKHYWYLIAAFTVVVLLGLRYYFRTEAGAYSLDRLKLNLPIAGPLYRKAAIARFTRTLATLLGSGVSILESLDIVKEVAGNAVLASVVANARKGVEKGERMSQTLKISEEFPPDVVQMVSVAEETGAMDGMLNKIADFYDMTVNYAVKRLTTVIEPLFLAVMGIMVGCIMASMLLPIFDMVKTLRH